ncbi:MAG TPA: amino acid permease [Syntrophorhabdus sp.]|nr:amino acid permease [Syntrophorhabdus sp.]HPW35668.1 amino acid permease [Syntrophorhabdus sp.]HQP56225.1 amino acid permease [Syntrophorhabdus sp.]
MKKTLSVLDVVALIVGIVVGVGIFKTPSLVAANAGSVGTFLLTWVLGGAISFVGALCYAELATAYPHPGGEYHYLTRAYGPRVSFLFAWARMTVIQTGSIAMLSFVLGDYMSRIYSLGPYSASIYGAAGIIILTVINIIGIREGKTTQNLLTVTKIIGLLIVVIGGVFFSSPFSTAQEQPYLTGHVFGLAMIFVLLTYGGWNEAAYISAELKGSGRGMVHSLLWGILIITSIYVLINWVYVHVLGIVSVGKSDAIVFDVMVRIVGHYGAVLSTVLIAISALGAMNATIITGARTNYALGTEFSIFRFLGAWHESSGTPANALIVQGAISFFLVVLGSITMKGFVTMVEYTAPIFWLFFFLTTLSIIILRLKEPEAKRPFVVPGYPVTPLLFCAICIYMLVSSIQYTGIGALTGIAVFLTGTFFMKLSKHHVTKRR